MSASILRVLVFVVPVCGALGLGVATSARQFGWLEGAGADGVYMAVSGEPAAVRDGDVVRVAYGNEQISVTVTFPAHLDPAESVPVTFELRDARGVHTGPARFEVEESGAFVAGRLTAEVEGEHLEGGLRVMPVASAQVLRPMPATTLADGAEALLHAQ